jgi:hypothetical protein
MSYYLYPITYILLLISYYLYPITYIEITLITLRLYNYIISRKLVILIIGLLVIYSTIT